MFGKSLFIFRRDLRIHDNIGLIECCKNSDKVILAFIFTPEQTKKNKYFSNNCFQFLLESLEDLKEQIKEKEGNLNTYYGENEDIIKSIIREEKIEAIYQNMDYTPYSVKRDRDIKRICEDNEVVFNNIEDYLLHPVGSILKEDGKPYLVYTYFKNLGIKKEVNEVRSNRYKNYIKRLINSYDGYKLLEEGENENINVRGGRDKGLKILMNIKDFKDYGKCRDFLTYETTNLSSYIKFGCLSIREVYHKIVDEIGKGSVLINQLYWREFYYYIVWYFPEVIGSSMKEKYDKIKWRNNKEYFRKWCRGETGFPIVDACMRQMNETGYMHNRGRLIVSNFLIKLLGIDWRWGEKYFAQKLVDYDPSVNNGNWQWSSGSGADSQQYNRIFNPTLQIEKFDKNCEYIKRWVPELIELSNKEIIKWIDNYEEYKEKYDIKYVEPIINYEKSRKEVKELYSGIYG